jgi:iron complex outermembrane receptor protein
MSAQRCNNNNTWGNYTMKRSTRTLTILALALSTASVGTYAAELEEITVTAQKRSQSLQDIPMSVSVTSGETLQRASIVDLIDLQTSVPSLRVNQAQSSAQTNFFIRGYGNGGNNPGIEPAVSVYIDGVPRTRSASSLADLPNVASIEVLSGPQSTLFGKNASAGVINVTTMLPEDELGGSIEATAGNYGSRIVKGTITGPISENLSYRLSASDNSNDGYGTNITTGSGVNSRDRNAFRGQLLFEPADDLTVRFIADYNKIDEVCCSASSLTYGAASGVASYIASLKGLATTPIDPWARNQNMTLDPSNKLVGKGMSVQIDKDLGYATLTSITSSREQTLRSMFDADFSAADILGENRVDYDFETITQEVRLSSNGDGDLQWLVGMFYSEEDVHSERTVKYGSDVAPFANFLIGGGLAAAGVNVSAGGLNTVSLLLTGGATTALAAGWFVPGTGVVLEEFDMKAEALSIFTQLDYSLSDQLTVTLGLNYTEDEKNVTPSVIVQDPFAALPLTAVGLGALAGLQLFPPFPDYGPGTNESGNFKSDDVTHTFRLAYNISDAMTVYAGHSTGFKAISVNMSVDGRTPGKRAADPEEATNVEIGLKATFDNGYINLALFEQSIEGFQSNIFGGTGFNLTNAGKETHEGVELDSMFALSENLIIGLSAIYMDAVYDSFLNGTCDKTGLAEPQFACPAGQSTIDLSGRSPAGIHEISYNVNATYNFAMDSGVEGFFRVEFLHEKDVKTADLIPFNVANRGFDNVNASLGFSSANGGWDAMLWGRNLTDHKTLISAFPTPAQPGSFSGYPNPPRTYGFTLRKNF